MIFFKGQGKYFWKDGQIHEGNWTNDLIHGYGEKIYGSNQTQARFEGNWVNGNTSEGTLTYKDGCKYKGTFKNGFPHGQGLLKYVSRKNMDSPTEYKGTFYLTKCRCKNRIKIVVLLGIVRLFLYGPFVIRLAGIIYKSKIQKLKDYQKPIELKLFPKHFLKEFRNIFKEIGVDS